jgi:endonuclease-8
MPEGDTVWLAGRRLSEALAGHTLVRAELRVPRYAGESLAGRDVLEVASRGKHLLIRLSGNQTLHTHFRMDGAWHLYRRGERWRGGPAWQVRALLSTQAIDAVGYRLPVLDLLPTTEEHRVVGHLGPDLLAETFDADEAAARFRAQGTREIGEALLDQRVLAGLGNLYRTELCFLLGVTPWTAVADGPDPGRVVELARRMLVANRDSPAQITTGESRRGRQHWVFERRTCLRCDMPVATGRQGPEQQERITYWCPRCQAGPAPRQ